MKYNLLKKIGKIALLAPILYFSTPGGKAIAPEFKSLPIEYSKPLKEDRRKVIVLDPGHGMSNRASELMDFGMIYPDYKEAEIVLDKVKNIEKMLDPAKYKIILTRKDNETHCPIESRPEIANENDADIFISFHTNDYQGWKSISGSEVYYRKENSKELKNKSKELAELAAKDLEDIAGISNRWVVQEDYLMLKGIKCPAVLIDMGYPLNEQDKKKITESKGIEKAVLKTIEVFLNQAKDSSEISHKYL